MKKFTIRFISGNKHKLQEANEILSNPKIKLILTTLKIEELQTENTENLIRDKILKAYKVVRRPLIVEHTGLYLKYLNDFPGGLTQIFWDKLQADKFSELFGKTKLNKVLAKTVIGYCDGKMIKLFSGEISGKISQTPKGNKNFQWDCVFIPDNYTKTFAELGKAKNKISMRKIAFEKFEMYLNKNFLL